MLDRTNEPISPTSNADVKLAKFLQILESCERKLRTKDLEFDTYENVGGKRVRRAVSMGIRGALLRAIELSNTSPNEFVLMHTVSRTIILRLKSPQR
jgi:hypothetical protein